MSNAQPVFNVSCGSSDSKHKIIRKMNEIKIFHDSSSFGRLPDEMVLQILRKLLELKTLCLCKLVSRRFHHIVLQVEAISFTTFPDPPLDQTSLNWNDSHIVASLSFFGCKIWSLKKFERVRSLHIQLPSSFDDHLLFKWKINFGNRFDSFLFLSLKSIYNKKELYVNENGHAVEDMELNREDVDIPVRCLFEAVARVNTLHQVLCLPLLEKVSLTDSGKRGKISRSGGKLADLRNWLSSPYQRNMSCRFCQRTSWCKISLLELPVSGYVMKGVTLTLIELNDLPHDNDNLLKYFCDDDTVEDKEEAAYSEAMIEILKKYRGRMKILIRKAGAAAA